MMTLCREDVTRTRDPYVPNVVRYQLRHFSIAFANFDYLLAQILPVFSKAGAKVLLFFDMTKFFAIILHFFCGKCVLRA